MPVANHTQPNKKQPMKKLPITIQCAAIAGLIMAGGLSASAQTLELQLKAANYNAGTGVWTDSSGNGNTATYSGASIPTLVAGLTPNGSSAVNLTGIGSLLLNSSIAAGSGYTVFAYCQVASGAGRNALTGGDAPLALEYDIFNHNQDFLTEYTADIGHGTATIPTTSFSLIDLAVSSAGGSFNFNGSPDGTTAGATFGQPITRIGNNHGGGDGFAGYISEIDIYSGVLTAGQIITVESQLTASYVTPVPEPATWAMMVGGFGMLLAARRFRRPQA
jgi:hypothetical protein